jgi:hypothetical protein
MDTGGIVVVSCGAPKEKFWGVLLALTTAGATVRGLPLDTFEDWLRQCAVGTQQLVGPTTIFVPSHRLERIEVDESAGVVEGLAPRFARLTGRDARQELLGEQGSAPATEPEM